MIVLKFYDEFINPIKKGYKRQTIRKEEGLERVKVGRRIQLVNEVGKKILQSKISKISNIQVSIMNNIIIIYINDKEVLKTKIDDFIRAEGFLQRNKFIEFMNNYFKNERMVGKLIEWEYEDKR